jgi:hypothetical protein
LVNGATILAAGTEFNEGSRFPPEPTHRSVSRPFAPSAGNGSRYGGTLVIMGSFAPGTFPPPPPFIVETDIDATAWIDEGFLPFQREV